MTRRTLFRVRTSDMFSLVLRSSIFLFHGAVLINCQSKLNQEEYIQWLRDYKNGAHVKETFSGLIFDLQYQPEEYMRIQRKLTSSSGERLSFGENSSINMQYYTLKISTESGIDLVTANAANIAEKKEKEYYFFYRFENDITLEDNGQILPCILYHFERHIEGDGGRTFVLGFEKPFKNSQEAKLVISSELFSSLPIKIKVSKSIISNPEL